MLDFFNGLLSYRQFIPHGHCYLWQPELVGLHMVSDLLIAAAYYSITAFLLYFVRQRHNVPFSGIFVLFGAFIIFCGTEHLMEVWTLWYPHYWLSGIVKAMTAAVSAYTAVELMPLIPKALALPNPALLEAANSKLENELKERRRTEEKLQEQEEFLRSIYDGVANAIFVVDVLEDGTFRYGGLNPATESLTGLHSDDLRGKTPSQALPPHLAEVLSQRYAECVGEGTTISYEECLPFPGEDSWWMTTLTPLYDNNGRIYRLIGTGTNITARKQAEAAVQKLNQELEIRVQQRTSELTYVNGQLLALVVERHEAQEALRESEENYRSVVDNVKEVIFQTDAHGCWTFLNPAWAEITGFSVEESIGTTGLNYVHPEDRDRHLQLFQPLVEGKKNYCRGEIRYLTKSKNSSLSSPLSTATEGSVGYRWIEVYARLIPASDGTIMGTSGTLNDITERKAFEEALRESEELFRSAFEDAAIGIALVATDGRFLRVNRSLCDMLGYSEPELQATTIRAITHQDDLDITLKSHKRIFDGDIHRFQIEKRYIHKRGHVVWIQLTNSVVQNVHGQPLYQVSQIQDITDRKRAESEIFNALAKEKQLSELKSRFVSITSHEFRTPLTTILSAAELLEYYGHNWTEEEKLEQLHLIQAAVQQMTNLLDDILLLGKAEAGKLEFKPTIVDLIKFCRHLAAEIQLNAGSDCAIAVISNYQGITAAIDQKLLRQILSNLLTNAIKYSPQGDKVTLELDCKNGEAVFQIQDRGIGIPKEDQQHLFEFFHRATNVGHISGTGLGLAIVKKCVDLHRGHISVLSEVGFGTTFRVCVPIDNQ